MDKSTFLNKLKVILENVDIFYEDLDIDQRSEFLKDLEVLSKKIKNRLNKPIASNLIFRFGRFKGFSIVDIPAWYLLWCYEQDWFKANNKDLYSYIKTNLKALKKQNELDNKNNQG